MSALGHYLEEEGLATVAISLIRPQTERTKPPRALWVPFELGRPFGPPRDPRFQMRVFLAALRLLERADGLVLLEDFPEDDPRAAPEPDWRPPFATAPAASLDGEVAQVAEAHRRWLAQYRRTTVGLSELPLSECGRQVGRWLRGEAPDSPRAGISAPLLLRFALDDLKAAYLEAAAAGDTRPSSRQLGDWLWNETALGGAIYALRAFCLGAEDERLKLIATNFMVPAARARPAG